jgi:hypothetical protein
MAWKKNWRKKTIQIISEVIIMRYVQLQHVAFQKFKTLWSSKIKKKKAYTFNSNIATTLFIWHLSLYLSPGQNRSSTSPCVSQESTEWDSPSDETGKTEAPCHSRCGTIKIPPCSEALSAEHRPKFCSPSPVMVTSLYKWKILERDEKQ